MNPASQAAAQWVLDTLRRRRPAYLLAEAYYEGHHRLQFATERFWSAFAGLFREFADNLCPTVVDTLADRLQVRGFEDTGSDAAGAPESVDAATGVWELNEMTVQAGSVMLDAVLYGDSYVIVWPDEDAQPAIFPQVPTECCVRYSSRRPGRVEYAGKVWRDDDKHGRLTLYFADRIEHYRTENPLRGGGIPDRADRFLAFDGEDGGAVVANGWGTVPVFHFANGPGVGRAGRSRLAPVIPVQDALNKAVVDMLVSMEFVSFPQRWAVGIEEERDPITGEARPPFRPGAERLWTVDNPDARFGEFSSADLRMHVAVQDSFRLEMARVSGTPVHLLMPGGTPPSGEALKTEEGRLVKAARDLSLAWGPRWAAAVTLAMRMNGDSTAGQLRTLWEPPETRSEREESEVAVLKGQSGVSQEQRQRELGYTEEQIQRMADERRAEQEAQAAAFAAGAPAGLSPQA